MVRGVSETHKTTYLDQDNICTGFGETNGNGLANAAGAAGDHGRLALEGEDAHCDRDCECGIAAKSRRIKYKIDVKEEMSIGKNMD